MSLFGAKKPNVTFERRPDDYFKHVYISKDFDAAIDYLSKEAHKTKMAMVHTLLEIGMSHYLGDKIAEYNKQVIAAREAGQLPKPTHFIIMLRRWAKEKGFDISKFI